MYNRRKKLQNLEHFSTQFASQLFKNDSLLNTFNLRILKNLLLCGLCKRFDMEL